MIQYKYIYIIKSLNGIGAIKVIPRIYFKTLYKSSITQYNQCPT